MEGLFCVMSESPGSGARLQIGYQRPVTWGSRLTSLCFDFFFRNHSTFFVELDEDS